MAQTILITGATSGIGRAAARVLAGQGARIVALGRDPGRLEALAGELGAQTVRCDLGSLADVRRAAGEVRERFGRLDALIANAGAVNSERLLSRDGYELTFAVNHLAHFLLVRELLPALQGGAPARLVHVSSEAARIPARLFEVDQLADPPRYRAGLAYCRSKLCNQLFSNELARRLAGTAVTSNALHPGAVASGFGHNTRYAALFRLARPFLVSEEKAAKTLVHAATAPQLAGVSGRYFAKCREKRPPAAAQDSSLQSSLWELSEQLVARALG